MLFQNEEEREEGLKKQKLPILSTSWYNKKSEATYSHILAFVRRSIWAINYFNDSGFDGEYMKIKPEQWESLLDQLVRAGLIGQSRVIKVLKMTNNKEFVNFYTGKLCA